MSERRSHPSPEPIYSEADVAEFRQEWEQQRKEGERDRELAAIRGRLEGLPELVRATVRAVLAEEKHSDNSRRRADIRWAVGIAAGFLVLVVPIEQVVLNLILRGHP